LVRDDVSCPKAPCHPTLISQAVGQMKSEQAGASNHQRCCLQRSSSTFTSFVSRVYVHVEEASTAKLVWLYTIQFELLSSSSTHRNSTLRENNSHLAASNSMQTAHALIIPGKPIPYQSILSHTFTCSLRSKTPPSSSFPSHLNSPRNTQLANLAQHILHPRVEIATSILVARRSIEVLLHLRHAAVSFRAETQLDFDERFECGVEVGDSDYHRSRQ
jgi:hypothetical protein